MLKVSLAELLLKIYVEVIIDENTDKIAEKNRTNKYRTKSQGSPKILKYICNISVWVHPLSTYAKYFKKLTFLTP